MAGGLDIINVFSIENAFCFVALFVHDPEITAPSPALNLSNNTSDD